MGKSVKAYILVLIVLFGFITYIQFTTEKPIDWSKTYNENDKIPFGTFIIYNELSSLFPNEDIEILKKSPYEYFQKKDSISSQKTKKTYLQIDEYASLDEVSAQTLLTFAANGNTVFLASSQIPNAFKDSLQLKLGNSYSFKGNGLLKLVNPLFVNDTILVEQGLTNVYFKKANYKTTTLLGTQIIKDSTYTNFIKTRYKKGTVYIHLQPFVFTNYSLLKSDNHKNYAQNVMGYLPNNNLIYKSKNKEGIYLSNSKLRFILSQPALKYAWYLSLILLIIFLWFNAKRKQRVVKVIKPLENSTLEFVKTIGNLYYETKDYNNVIEKKITYFLEHIRRVYYLDTQILDQKFVNKLTLKSNKSENDITQLVNLIAKLRATPKCNEKDLLQLNTLIEAFYTINNG